MMDQPSPNLSTTPLRNPNLSTTLLKHSHPSTTLQRNGAPEFADLLLAITCCWPELEPTDLELTGNVELGDARPDAAPAQPLWPMLFLPLTLLAPLALLATWQLVKGGSSRALRASHGGAP